MLILGFHSGPAHELGIELEKRSAILNKTLQSANRTALSGRESRAQAQPRRGLSRTAKAKPVKQSNN